MGKKVTAPSYLVKVSEEHTVDFYPGSKSFQEDHPERPVREEVPGKVHKEAKKPEEEESKPQKQRKPSARKPKEEKDSNK
jgi:ribosomal protein S4